MKRLIIVVLTGLLALSVTPTEVVYAASPSPTASESAEPSPTPNLTETTQRLRERIEKIVDEKREQVAGALDELANQRRGFIGEVQRVSAETLTIKTNKSTQILPITPNVSITKAGKVIPIDDIAVGDWAIVIGRIVDDEFQLERLLISSTTLRPQPQAVALGTLSALTRTTATVQPRNGEPATQFNLVRTTQYQDVEGNEVRLADVEEDMQVLAVGVNTNQGLEARVIRVLVPLADDNN